MRRRVATDAPEGSPGGVVVADWFDRYVADVQRYVARRIGAHAALDVVADTFRIALERFGDFDRQRGSERAWLFGIATNLVRRHWRSEERRLRAHLAAAVMGGAPGDPLVAIEDAVDARRRLERLVDKVCRLSPDDRDILVLTAWEGLDSGEVADVLEIPRGTVRSRLHRIRADLRLHETSQHDGGHDG